MGTGGETKGQKLAKLGGDALVGALRSAVPPGSILPRIGDLGITACVEHVKAAKPVLMLSTVVYGFLALAAVATGGYAIYKGAVGDSTLDLWGSKISTTDVGVPLVLAGLVAAIIIGRSVLSTLYLLAKLPPDTRNWR